LVCYKHATEQGVNTCSKCGEWICETCTIDVNNVLVCKECVSKYMNSSSGTTKKEEHRITHFKPLPSPFLAILFAILFPGSGLMYLGLMKKGFSVATLMFAVFYFPFSFTGMLVPIIYVSSIFVTHQIARKIISGEVVEDNITSLLDFFRMHKYLIIMLVLACSGLSFIERVFRAFHIYGFQGLDLVFMVIIGYLIWSFLVKKKN
jgi:hypothetical protein